MDKNNSFENRRHLMVDDQLVNLGIKDPRILEAFREVPRERFVSKSLQKFAYADTPLPIGYNVTISQPYIVAKMCEILQLKQTDVVLDIGTGSGYQAAILSQLCTKVYTIERVRDLANEAQRQLQLLGHINVEVIVGDGSLGYPSGAPFDKIKIAAATDSASQEWIEQLKTDGKIVFPRGNGSVQRLIEIQKNSEGRIIETDHGGVRFVPLIRE